MTLAARIFQRSLQEKLAFIPMGKAAEQAPGPGGAPVDPAAAGAPMDPGMDPAAGGAPMDPAMGGPPMDPAMGGMPPMDPAMGGAPPMDPAMGGAPMDPSMGPPPMDPAMMAGMPPPPPMEEPNSASTDVDENGKDDTMVPLEGMKDFTVGVIEAMKGRQTAPAKMEQEAAAAAAAGGGPGPVTGMPGFDPSSIQGPLKMATARALRGLKLPAPR